MESLIVFYIILLVCAVGLFVGVPVLAAFVIFGIARKKDARSGRALRRSFARLGNVVGLSLDEIIAEVGQPKRQQKQSESTAVLTWEESDIQFKLAFDADNVCQDIDWETRT